MRSLAYQLGETAHHSLLLRKARRLGVSDLTAAMRLAVARGAWHYASLWVPAESDPGLAALRNEELVALLLLGAHPFEPFAIRCAAQLVSRCDPARLARLARLERVSRPLAHIARAGLAHDPARASDWRDLLDRLGSPRQAPAGRLQHWSRFVSHSGITRDGSPRTDWLHART